MSVVKDFDPRLAFVSEASKLSELFPQEKAKLIKNIALSKILAYIYLVLDHYSDVIFVESNIYDTIKKIFPYADLIKESSTNMYWAINEVTLDSTIKSYPCQTGDILMPTYVSESSRVVYNIHNSESSILSITASYILLALNFFNTVVRSKTAGIANIIWKDPVALDTKLKDQSYDYMFGLYVGDKYLQAIDQQYLEEQDDVKLGLCMSFLDYINDLSQKKLGLEKLTRKLDETMIKAMVVNEDDFNTIYQITVVEVPIDPVKANLSNTLFALIALQSVPKIVTVTGFKDYSHINTIADIMKKTTFIIWDVIGKGLIQAKNIVHNKKIITNKIFLGEAPDLLISNLMANEALIKGFNGISIIRFGSANYIPLFIYPSLFTSSLKDGFASADTKSKMSKSKNDAVKSAFNNRVNKLNAEYRDTDRWVYTLSENIKSLSYDDAILASLLDSLRSKF